MKCLFFAILIYTLFQIRSDIALVVKIFIIYKIFVPLNLFLGGVTMKKIIAALTAACLTLGVTNANAAGPFFFKPYVGADLGYAFDEDVGMVVAGVKAGADIHKHFGVEGRLGTGITDDRHSGVDVEIDQYAALFGKVQTTNINGFKFYGLAGVGYVEAEASRGRYALQGDDTDFAFGVGAEYILNKNLGLNVEYLSYNQDINTVNLGLTYHF